jgi:phosphohistidine phosphatase
VCLAYFYLVKTLIIIRHAKAESAITLNDFERSLAARGMQDAPVMARKLIEKNITIDAFISSPAIRAKQTAALFCTTYGLNVQDIVFDNTLYNAKPQTIAAVIKTTADEYNCIALVAHNPGVTYFATELVKDVNIDNMPTCAVFAVKIYCQHWKDFVSAKKEFLFFDYPKNFER